jgi:transcriptional regulator with XRE-family HTH domain
MKVISTLKHSDVPEYIRVLKEQREIKNISQEDIAKKLKYSPMGISHFENGRREMKLSDVEKYATFVGAKVTILIDKK